MRPVVLLDTFYASLDVARSLGRRGVPVYALDANGPRIGARSRYVEYMGTPRDAEETVRRLTAIREDMAADPVLIPLSDANLLLLDKYDHRLREHYLYPRPGSHSYSSRVSKTGLVRMLEDIEVSVPGTKLVQGSPAHDFAESLEFPVIVKPEFHDRWLQNEEVADRIGTRKVLLVTDRDELLQHVEALHEFDDLVIQEYVPGPTENLFYFVGYRGQDGDIHASFVGQKIRTLPEGLGSETLLRSVRCGRVRAVGETILRETDHVGIAGIDVKLDARDGRHKVIEVNWRMGLSDGLAVACGEDLPFLYYRDVQGRPMPGNESSYRTGRYWCWLSKDVEWMIQHRESRDVSIGQWVRSHCEFRPMYAGLASDDPSPFLRELSVAARSAASVFSR